MSIVEGINAATGAVVPIGVNVATQALNVHMTNAPTVTVSTTPGGRGAGTTGYSVIRSEANLVVIDQVTAVNIGAAAVNSTHLIGVNITTPLTGTCVITGFLGSSGAAASITLPIGAVGFREFKAALNGAGQTTVTVAAAGDSTFVQVLWRPV